MNSVTRLKNEKEKKEMNLDMRYPCDSNAPTITLL